MHHVIMTWTAPCTCSDMWTRLYCTACYQVKRGSLCLQHIHRDNTSKLTSKRDLTWGKKWIWTLVWVIPPPLLMTLLSWACGQGCFLCKTVKHMALNPESHAGLLLKKQLKGGGWNKCPLAKQPPFLNSKPILGPIKQLVFSFWVRSPGLTVWGGMCEQSVWCFVELLKSPVEGFSAGLVDDSNIFEWSVHVMGPPDTL